MLRPSSPSLSSSSMAARTIRSAVSVSRGMATTLLELSSWSALHFVQVTPTLLLVLSSSEPRRSHVAPHAVGVRRIAGHGARHPRGGRRRARRRPRDLRVARRDEPRPSVAGGREHALPRGLGLLDLHRDRADAP